MGRACGGPAPRHGGGSDHPGVFPESRTTALPPTLVAAPRSCRRINYRGRRYLAVDHYIPERCHGFSRGSGFNVTVVEDATATFERRGPDGTHYSADLMHRVALASLHGEFATVRSAQDILAAAGA